MANTGLFGSLRSTMQKASKTASQATKTATKAAKASFKMGNVKGGAKTSGNGSSSFMSGGTGWQVGGSVGSAAMDAVNAASTNTKYGQKSTTAGTILNSVGTAAMMTGNPYAVVGGLIAKGVGTILNLGFGDAFNEAGIQDINNNISGMRMQGNALAGAKNNTDLLSTWKNTNLGYNFNKDYVGDEGWWSHGVTKEFDRLKYNTEGAREYSSHALEQGIANVNKTTRDNIMENSIAFGGPIDIDPSTAIGYSLYTDKYINNNNGKGATKLTNLFAGTPAIFGFGGGIHSNGAAFDNGVSYIGSGGTHEENPYDGVQMGTDREGVPNLVEEGEVKWNDYIFSNRLIVPRGKRGNYGKRARKYAEGGELSKGDKVDVPYESMVLRPYEGKTFADAAKKIMKKNGADEMNDPITLRGIDAELSVLAGVQEKERQVQQLREMEEAIDNMSPEEFAMLQQQMESQQIAQQQQEEALRQQQMIPQGMEQMVPAEQMAAAYGGPIYGLGGLLNNWDTTKQAANKFDTGGFLKWWNDNIDSLIRKGKEVDFGKIYSSITGEEGPTDSVEVRNKLEEYYNEHPDKFQPLSDSKDDDKSGDTPEAESAGGQEVGSDEGTEEVKEVAPVKGPMAKVLEYKGIDAEQWNSLSDKTKERYLKQYKSSLSKAERKAFEQDVDNYDQQQLYKQQIDDYRKEQLASTLTKDDIKNLTYEQKLRLGKALDKNFDPAKYDTQNKREAIDDDLIELSKANEVNIGQLNEALAPSKSYKDWAIINPEDAWQTSYDWNSPLYGEATPVPVEAGSTKGHYKPRNWVNEEGNVVVGGESYPSMKDYELSDAYLRPRYDLAVSAASDNEEGRKLWSDYVANLNPEYAESYDPLVVFGENYANNLQDYEAFKQYITDNYGTLNAQNPNGPRSGFFDQIAGQMHGTYAPVRSRELYQMKDNEGTYLTPEENWRDNYTLVNTETKDDGTTIYTLAPNAGMHFNRVEGTPKDLKVNPDGTIERVVDTTVDTDNDPFPKAAEWPYLVGAGIQAGATLYNALKSPDYSNADSLIKAATNQGYLPISFTPIGNHATYKPLDRLFQQNILNAKTAATDRNIMNSGVNQGAINAALLANARTGQMGAGNLFRQEQEYDDALRFKTGDYNKDTDKFNAEGILKADMADQDAYGRARQSTLDALRYGYAMRQAADDAQANAVSAGLSGLVNLASAYGQNKYNQDLLGWGMRHNSWGPGVFMQGSKRKTKAKGGRIRRKKGIGF